MSVINAVPLLAAAGGDYQISRSVRTRASASGNFSRTPAAAGSRTTWTWSGWVKRGTLSTQQRLFSCTNASAVQTHLSFTATSDVFTFQFANATVLVTSQVFRDPSAWYHVVLAVDTTQATAANRAKLYINGNQVTAFSTATYMAQNATSDFNNNVLHNIASFNNSTEFFDGYLTEINFIDGQALTPSSFGQTDPVTGVWQPKKYLGTYGTNGFYLNFADNSAATAAAIGKDSSGNGNNWTPNNISVTAGATYDSMLDVPTLYADGGNGRGNYAVWNPLSVVSPTTLADGNLGVVTGTTGGGGAFSTITIPTSGKYYFEFIATAVSATLSDNARIGLATASVGNYVLYKSDGNKVVDGTTSAYGSSFALNDVIGCAIDVDGGTVTFYKNNVTQGSITYSTSNGNYFAYTQDGSGTVSVTANINFGQRPFSYTPPTGFVALNTQNLPTPTISNGATVMAASTYSGNSSTQSVVNSGNNTGGIAFQPDLVWIKSRSGAYDNMLYDALRGVNINLRSNTTAAEVAGSPSEFTSFNSNGFTVVSNGTQANVNLSGATYVAWQWKAGGTSSSNTNGSITSTVSVGATQGFSIVTYTGTGANATVGHGLGVAPKMVIVKNRSQVYAWRAWHTNLTGGTYYLTLNATDAQATSATIFTAVPTSTVFNVGTDNSTNGSTHNMVAYCFAEVAGFSKFGSYTGNGSTDGPFVYCGFRPRFVMMKRTDAANDWIVYDSSRSSYNAAGAYLLPDLSNAEGTGSGTSDLIDFTANGFKIRCTTLAENASAGTYIFMAFAENPFKNSLAR